MSYSCCIGSLIITGVNTVQTYSVGVFDIVDCVGWAPREDLGDQEAVGEVAPMVLDAVGEVQALDPSQDLGRPKDSSSHPSATGAALRAALIVDRLLGLRNKRSPPHGPASEQLRPSTRSLSPRGVKRDGDLTRQRAVRRSSRRRHGSWEVWED